MKLLSFKMGEQYGLADLDGKQVVEPRFRYANESHEGFVVASSDNDDLIILDTSTLTTRECRGLEADDFRFSKGLLSARRRLVEHAPIGYVNHNGDMVITPQFAWVSAFDRSGATVKIGREDMVERRIDRDGNVKGQAFLQIRPFHPDGLYCGACIGLGDDGMVIIDGGGHRITDRTFDVVWQEHEGLIPVVFEAGWIGWVNVKGEDVYRLWADGVGNHFESGLVPVEEKNGQWGLMNVDGQWVVHPEFDVVESVGHNRFMLGHRDQREDPSVRLADGHGNFLGNHAFGRISRFSEGVAQVWRVSAVHDDRDYEYEYNYINLNGELLLPQWS